MSKTIIMLSSLCLFIGIQTGYADEAQTITNEQCVNTHFENCLNSCINSENMNCSQQCKADAESECASENQTSLTP